MTDEPNRKRRRNFSIGVQRSIPAKPVKSPGGIIMPRQKPLILPQAPAVFTDSKTDRLFSRFEQMLQDIEGLAERIVKSDPVLQRRYFG